MAVSRRYLPGALLCALTVGGSACGNAVQPGPAGDDSTQVTVPAQGTPATLDIGNWNLDWFGSTDFGPTDEVLQLRNVAAVMGGADLDIWGLEEVVDADQFADLLSTLPGYSGLLANDPSVVDGAAYYTDFDDTEQKVALVWRTSVATLESARVILGAYD
jgi:hypothetical protein